MSSVSSLARRGVLLSALLGLVLLPAAVRAADKAEPVPFSPGPYIPDIATFLNIGACSPAGYSWDGRNVYFTANMSGAGQVYRITDQGWPYQLTTFEDGIEGFNLSWNGAMAIVSASVGGDENAQLYLLDTTTGRIEPLTQQPKVQFGSVTWIPDDSGIYYRSNEENGKDFFIYRMEFPSRKITKVYDDTEGYNSVAELALDNSVMIVSNSTSNVNNDLYVLDLKSGQSRQLTKDEGDVSYESVNLMPDKKTIWLTSNGNPDGISKLGTMSIDASEITWVKDDWLDPKWEVEGVSFSRDYKTMVVRQNEDGYGRLKLRDVASKKMLPNPPLDGILGSAIFDKDGACILSFSGPTRAPDVWKWNPRTKEMKQLTYTIYAGIDRNLFKDPKLVRYPTFDGKQIPAFLYLPPDYKPGTPVPFVVDAHGGPESQFRPDFIRNFQYLMLNGYGVLAPNVRGSSGYGIEYLNLDNYKNRKDSLKDYKAGVDWLVKEGYTKPGMIGIRGGSYGGYVVLGMLTEYPDLFAAGIDIVGIANFQTFLMNTAPYRRALRESEYGPLDDPEFLKSISPIHKANTIKTPLLVVHGANDPRVPVGEARQILQAVKMNGGIVDSLIFADEGHGSGKRVNTIAEYRKHVAFFDSFLKPNKLGEKKD